MSKPESTKSVVYKEFSESILFLPKHFSKKGQTLDAAFDGYRSHKTLSNSSLDLILMSYRYAHWFESVLHRFSTKKIKPPEMLDLWLLGFTALLTRDNVPAFAIVSECVNLAKSSFGPHTGGITNAFLRHIERNTAALKSELLASPTIALPTWLLDRWSTHQNLDRIALQFIQRPAAGVWGFDDNLLHLRATWSDEVFASHAFQAMDAGSYDFCRWLCEKLSSNDKNFLDTCAAPGGKAIFITQFLKLRNQLAKVALCEAKSARMRQLKENWLRWNLPHTPDTFLLHEWGKDPILASVASQEWDVLLCDLPCSGSGTIFTRPDVMFRDWKKDIESLRLRQQAIVEEIKTLSYKKLFVSICSTDSEEISNVSRCLGTEPSFISWDSDSEAPREGIVGWYCSA